MRLEASLPISHRQRLRAAVAARYEHTLMPRVGRAHPSLRPPGTRRATPVSNHRDPSADAVVSGSPVTTRLSRNVTTMSRCERTLPPICAATRSPAWLPVLRPNVVICVRSRAWSHGRPTPDSTEMGAFLLIFLALRMESVAPFSNRGLAVGAADRDGQAFGRPLDRLLSGLHAGHGRGVVRLWPCVTGRDWA